MKTLLVKPPYINKFPLNDSNKTDWKGLDQYLKYLYGESDSDRDYALKEVGNIFPNYVPIGGYNFNDPPPYIPRQKDAIAIKYRGYEAWHYGGIMNEEERAAIVKYYDVSWQIISDETNAPQYYDSGWNDIKWMKYYDGSSWITCFSLVPSGMMALFTSDPSGWTNRSTTMGINFLYTTTLRGTTGGANSHSHSSTNINCSGVISADITSIDTYTLGLSCGVNHSHGTYVSHPASSQTFYPKYVDYRVFETPVNAGDHIPSGALIFWSGNTGDIPSGWTYVSKSGYYIRSNTSGTGGVTAAFTTGHNTTASSSATSTGSSSALRSGSIAIADASDTHNHSYSDSTHVNAHSHSSVIPSYFDVVLMYANANAGEVPVNGVAPFWDVPGTIPGTTWSRVTTADDRLLRASTVYGGTGGSTTHTHGHVGVESGPDYTPYNSRVSGSYSTIRRPHSHSVNATDHPSSTKNSMPAFYSVLLYKRTA